MKTPTEILLDEIQKLETKITEDKSLSESKTEKLKSDMSFKTRELLYPNHKKNINENECINEYLKMYNELTEPQFEHYLSLINK